MIQEHEIVLYQVEDINICVNVVFKDETFWMTQKAMAELFDVNVPAISKHLSNIFEEGELFKEATVSKMEIVQMEGNRKVKREPEFYNLDAIIAVGYRVNSKKATRFRQWATKTLKDYITKGFVLNDDMLKNGKPFGKDYFAVTGKTAAELVYERVNAEKKNTNAGTSSEDGIWFGNSEPDDSKGALLYDTYEIEELSCESKTFFKRRGIA